MAMKKRETTQQGSHSDPEEDKIDRKIEDTFPASDPPSTGGVTRIEQDQESSGGGEQKDKAQKRPHE
jgi:hypothetical protein